MITTMLYVVLCSSFFLSLSPQTNSKPIITPSPFLSPTTLLNYQKMVQTFKVFIYEPNEPKFNDFTNPIESLFYSLLKNSTFITQNPNEAHLFFVPFSSDIRTRSLARIISRVRTRHPFWHRTLGADHFFLSCAGIGRESDRKLVELKKNAIQVSCFPTRRENFVPHKDITLPGLHAPHAPGKALANATVNDKEHGGFCVLEYGNDASLIGEALRLGCVPVVVVAEGPVNDVPFLDVLRWSEMAVFVRNGEGVKHVLGSDTWKEKLEYMRGLGAVASKHFVWNQPPQPLDAFNTVMYQLWLRRHAVRYGSVQQD